MDLVFPDEKDLDAGLIATTRNRDYIGIREVWQIYILVSLNSVKRADTVAPNCRRFEF